MLSICSYFPTKQGLTFDLVVCGVLIITLLVHYGFSDVCHACLLQGFRGRRRNCYSLAVRAAHKALQYAYISRRLKKRDMRKVMHTYNTKHT